MEWLNDVLDKIAKNKGFDINALPPGTRVAVNTCNSLYELIVLGNRRVTAFGGTLPDGGVRFRKPTKLIIAGSTFGGSMLKLNWVGKDMRVEFVPEEGEYAGKTFSTSPVQRVSIEGRDGDWAYTAVS